MSSSTQTLLEQIDTFLSLTGMKKSNFGKYALNDPMLYSDLKRGRRLWADTEARIRSFMSTYARAKKNGAL